MICFLDNIKMFPSWNIHVEKLGALFLEDIFSILTNLYLVSTVYLMRKTWDTPRDIRKRFLETERLGAFLVASVDSWRMRAQLALSGCSLRPDPIIAPADFSTASHRGEGKSANTYTAPPVCQGGLHAWGFLRDPFK